MSTLKVENINSFRPDSPLIMFQHSVMYEDPIKNIIYVVFHHIAIVLSLIVNVTLIALIIKCRRKEFGAYRFLLLTFSSVDLYYGIVHFLVMPIPEAWANAFYMGAHGYITGKLSVCWFAGTHSHSFVVLVFHFLYRLLAVKGSPFLGIFSKKWFFALQFVCVLIVGAAWFSVLFFLFDADEFVVNYMELILKDYSIGTSLPIDQYSTAVFWTNGTFVGPRWKPIFGVFVMASTMSGGYGFMVYAAYKIGWYMKQNTSIQSERTLILQRQLMRALIYQTILPLITAYSPPLISVVNPFLGISLPFIADISPIFCGSHPWLDGCVLIWTIKEYRTLLFRCFRRHQKSRETRTTTRLPSFFLSLTTTLANIVGEKESQVQFIAVPMLSYLVTSALLSSSMFIDVKSADVTPNSTEICSGSLMTLMGSICDICSELSLGTNEHVRKSCKSNCFRNVQFRACIALFVPVVRQEEKSERTARISNREMRALRPH